MNQIDPKRLTSELPRSLAAKVATGALAVELIDRGRYALAVVLISRGAL